MLNAERIEAAGQNTTLALLRAAGPGCVRRRLEVLVNGGLLGLPDAKRLYREAFGLGLEAVRAERCPGSLRSVLLAAFAWAFALTLAALFLTGCSENESGLAPDRTTQAADAGTPDTGKQDTVPVGTADTGTPDTGGRVDVLPASQPDATPTPATDTRPDTRAIANSLTMGSGYVGDTIPEATNDGFGDTLTGVGLTFHEYAIGAVALYFQLTSTADIAGRSVVIYTGDITDTQPNIIGGSAGPSSGHVALGTFTPPSIELSGPTTLLHACLTTADRSKDGWSVGTCTYVASAQITMTK